MIRLAGALICVLAAPVTAEEVQIEGPAGALGGIGTWAAPDAPVAVIIPGSGPIDCDGNGSMLKSDAYKLLAEGLAERGVSTVRIDKRGFFSSAAVDTDPNAVTIEGYAQDMAAWVLALNARGTGCVWLAGHSEGGLVALVAAKGAVPVCGLILMATPGRPIGDMMREQFARNPANAQVMEELTGLVDDLEAGLLRDPDKISLPLRLLFSEGLQRYMIQLFAYDPVKVAKGLTLPVLIVQGDKDVQVMPKDAALLANALPQAERVDIPGMTHMLKADVPGNRFATYGDPTLPLMPGLADTIAAFITAPR